MARFRTKDKLEYGVQGLTISVYTNPKGKTPQERTHAVITNHYDKIVFDPSGGLWFKIADGNEELDYHILFTAYREKFCIEDEDFSDIIFDSEEYAKSQTME